MLVSRPLGWRWPWSTLFIMWKISQTFLSVYLGRRMNLLARMIANVPNVLMRRCVKSMSWLKEMVTHRRQSNNLILKNFLLLSLVSGPSLFLGLFLGWVCICEDWRGYRNIECLSNDLQCPLTPHLLTVCSRVISFYIYIFGDILRRAGHKIVILLLIADMRYSLTLLTTIITGKYE